MIRAKEAKFLIFFGNKGIDKAIRAWTILKKEVSTGATNLTCFHFNKLFLNKSSLFTTRILASCLMF